MWLLVNNTWNGLFDHPLKEKNNLENCRKNFNKPICIAASILDINKVLMQTFYYDYIKNKYSSEAGISVTYTEKK